MALTLARWMAALVIGALIVLVLLFVQRRPTGRDKPHAGWALLEDFRRADAHAARSAARVRRSQVVDSVVSSLARLPRTARSRTVYGKGLEPSLSVLRMAVDGMAVHRPTTSVAPIELALTFERPVWIQGHEVQGNWNSPERILPRTSGEPCVVIVRFPAVFGSPKITGDDYSWMRNRVFRGFQNGEILGACGFYEAFGTPGPEIDRWLRAGAWRLGSAGPVAARQEYRAYVDSALLSPWSAWLEGDFRRQFTPTGYRCMTGDASTCASIVLGPRADEGLPMHMRVRENGALEFRGSYGARWIDGNLGWPQGWMFADMIRLLGTEGFQRFWTSDKAPAEAFQTAFGRDIGEWTVAWARDVYGVRERGPAVPASTAVVAALVVLLSLGAAIASVRRQQAA